MTVSSINAIRILPAEKAVVPITIPDRPVNYLEIKAQINDVTLEHVIILPHNSPIGGIDFWIDDAGMLKDDNDYWKFRHMPQPYAGPALVIGFNYEGESLPLTKEQVDFILPRLYTDIVWIGKRNDLIRAFNEGQASRPMVTINDNVSWLMPNKPKPKK